jgi:hypothetical protein
MKNKKKRIIIITISSSSIDTALFLPRYRDQGHLESRNASPPRTVEATPDASCYSHPHEEQ